MCQMPVTGPESQINFLLHGRIVLEHNITVLHIMLQHRVKVGKLFKCMFLKLNHIHAFLYQHKIDFIDALSRPTAVILI